MAYIAHTPEERAAQANHYRRDFMATQPPTPAQLQLLRKLAHKGRKPENRLQAHDAIDALLQARGGA